MSASDSWLFNLFEYEAHAAKQLPRMVWDYYASGAWDEVTLRENRAAFERIKLYPRMMVDVSQRDLSVELLGRSLSMPILVAPMAFQCLAHPQGELATAIAANKAGTILVLSTLSTVSLEDVATVGPQAAFGVGGQWFQLYVHRDRGLTKALVDRAYNAGYTAICLTVDAPLLGQRERDRQNRFALPDGLDLANFESLMDMGIPQRAKESGLFSYFVEQIDPSLTWQDLDWLQSISPLPIVMKGILRGDDAKQAVQHGAKAIIVSNHGGRQLDGAVATIDALEAVVQAVAGSVDVLLDGGIRRGTDVLKAIALGAKAVLVGRPILWGLATAGEAGVHQVLEVLRAELSLAMALSGCDSLAKIDPSLCGRSGQS